LDEYFTTTNSLGQTKSYFMKKYGIMVLGSVALAVALVSFRAPARARTEKTAMIQTSWGKIGQGTAQPTNNGVSTVNASNAKPVHSIKLKVISGGVNIHRCEVWFSDGSKKEIEMRNDVPAGAESREISFSDKMRGVTKIVIWYDTRNYGNQKAEMELWGKTMS
jgi:hypothetical protein